MKKKQQQQTTYEYTTISPSLSHLWPSLVHRDHKHVHNCSFPLNVSQYTQQSPTLFPVFVHTHHSAGFFKKSQFVPLKIHHSSAVMFIRPLPVALQRAARNHSRALIIQQGCDAAADLREVRERVREMWRGRKW